MAEWVYFNPNKKRAHGLDCTVRAICAVTGWDWETAHAATALEGHIVGDVQDANCVWVNVLRRLGFQRGVIPNTCPLCYTVGDFADDHPSGKYVLCTGNHAVAVVSGRVLDSFDSTTEIPEFYLYMED